MSERGGTPIPPQQDADRGPEGPLDISPTGWKQTLLRVRKRMVRDRVPLAAGGLAYHWFLAFFPAVIAGLGFLALINVSGGTLHHLTHGIDKALPAGASGVFDAAVKAATKRSSATVTAAVVGIAIALWAASSGTSAFQQTLDVAYEVPVSRKFLGRRIRSVPMMAAIVVLGGFGGGLIIFGAPIGSAIEGPFPFHGVAFEIVWNAIRWGGAIVLLTLLFSVLYYLGPNRESPRWQWVSPGGLFATAIFLAASLGFSYYVSAFGNYGKTYGSFAGVAIFIFWLYLVGMASLLGAEINAELERQAAAAGGDPKARATADELEGGDERSATSRRAAS